MKYTKEVVGKYIGMFEDYKIPCLIKNTISKYLKTNSTILELGTGAGFDYEQLSKMYQVTGSDYSEEFIKFLENKFGNKFLNIDARNIKLNQKFDLIYSNKVLHHLDKEELEGSLKSQYETLNEGGYIITTLWYGQKVEHMHGMNFHYYNEKDIKGIINKFKLIEIIKYEEFESNDSMLIILRR